MDLVSVLLTCYNSENTIIEALDSIYNQTYPRIELIIGDDCSQDNTREIVTKWCREHKNRFERVLFSKARKNTKMFGNFSTILNHARGEWIHCMAGDDIMLPQATERKVLYAKNNNYQFVFTKIEVFGSDKKLVDDAKRWCIKSYNIFDADWKTQYNEIIKDSFIGGGPMGGFYKKDFFLAHDGLNPDYPILTGDYPWFYNIIAKSGIRIQLLDEVLMKYRIENKSICHQNPFLLTPFQKDMKKFFYRVRVFELIKAGQYKTAWEQNIKYLRLRKNG